MRNLLITAALAVGLGVAVPGSASAGPLKPQGTPAAAGGADLIPAQYWNGRGNDWRRYCYRGERVSDCRHRLRNPSRYHDRYDRRRHDDRRRGDVGTAVALAVLGQALGVNIVGQWSDRDHYHRYRSDRRWHDWCRSRYRSYDYRSGTYMHSDGYRRYCRRY